MKKILMLENTINEKLRLLVREIINSNKNLDKVVLIGIRTGGAFLASRIKNIIKEFTKKDLPIGILDITLYRDDWTRIGPAPIVKKTEIPFSVDDKVVILVDDVLFTGRTVRAAIDAILDYGRPKSIKLAVFIDRGEKTRELPICANYVAKTVETSSNETINVYLKEQGHKDMVTIEEVKR